MLFNSLTFVVFFLGVYSLYIVLRHRYQNLLLLVASYVFYGWWDWRFLSLILLSTVVDYWCGLGMEAATSTKKKRRLLAVSMIFNLGLLFTFKYFNFFADSLFELMAMWGVEADLRFIKVVLPVGISFYTFQTMSYTIDIYRGELKPTRKFFDFALFVSFFPQLVAGPIERAKQLLPQVIGERKITFECVRQGAWLILLGYFKKTVIADNMAPFTQELFDFPGEVSGTAVLFGLYAFALQIYGDFSGYSDIARGLAKCLGFDLMLNFRMPYFATNPSDFWRRWHISLSTWLRDYLYIPLGGNRKSGIFTYRNLMLTMLLGGLWHGAAWNFVAWGLFHGGILCIHRLISPTLKRISPQTGGSAKVWKLACVFFFFHITCIGWLLFGVNQLSDCWLLLGNLFSPLALTGKITIFSVVVIGLPLLVLQLFKESKDDMLCVLKFSRVWRLAIYVFLFAAIVFCGASRYNEFIYFQF